MVDLPVVQMFIHHPRQSAPQQQERAGLKEIKVKIPLEYHWRLHTLKLTAGVHISDVVRAALSDYFSDVFEKPQR